MNKEQDGKVEQDDGKEEQDWLLQKVDTKLSLYRPAEPNELDSIEYSC